MNDDYGIPPDLLADGPPLRQAPPPPRQPDPPRAEPPAMSDASAQIVFQAIHKQQAEIEDLQRRVEQERQQGQAAAELARQRGLALQKAMAQPNPARSRPQAVSAPSGQARSRPIPRAKTVTDLPEVARDVLAAIKRVDPAFTDADYVGAYRW